MSSTQPPRSSIPSTLPKRPSGAPYIAAIVVLVLLIVGLIWFKFSRKKEPVVQPPVVQSVTAVVTPPVPVFDIPAPPEEDAAAEAGEEAGTKKPVSGPSLCTGECQGDASGALRSALQAAGAASRGCYERALRTNPMLQGRLVVAVRVASNGNVCGASIAQDSLGAGDVSSCVLGLFRGRKFPPSTGGRCVDVQVPLSFKPKEEKK